MTKEIERKFLIDESQYLQCSYAAAGTCVSIKQGYLFNIKGHVGRVRVTSSGTSVFTYKGPSDGISRTEVEFGIPVPIGRFLMALCGKVLHKTRSTFPTLENTLGLNDTVWEVDTFHNLDEPLIVAEMEVPDEDYRMAIPDWIRREVSKDSAYYNSNLIKRVK